MKVLRPQIRSNQEKQEAKRRTDARREQVFKDPEFKAKMKAQMREVKLRLCKYELECTCGVGDGAEAQPRRAAREEPEDDEEENRSARGPRRR